jgi:hypothetical protein
MIGSYITDNVFAIFAGRGCTRITKCNQPSMIAGVLSYVFFFTEEIFFLTVAFVAFFGALDTRDFFFTTVLAILFPCTCHYGAGTLRRNWRKIHAA